MDVAVNTAPVVKLCVRCKAHNVALVDIEPHSLQDVLQEQRTPFRWKQCQPVSKSLQREIGANSTTTAINT